MGTEQWHSDINITDAFARNIIERQFHELSPINIMLIGEGWDNKVFLVNNQFVFRFPHRKIAAKLIERENAVLGYLQDIVNFEIPILLYGHDVDDIHLVSEARDAIIRINPNLLKP